MEGRGDNLAASYVALQMTFPALWKQLEKSLSIIEGLRGEPETVGSFLEGDELHRGSALLK